MGENSIDRMVHLIDPIGCVLNSEGIILEVSTGWKNAAEQNGLQLQDYAVGTNYLQHCVSRDSTTLDIYRGLSKVLSGHAPLFGSIYPCHHTGSDEKWFYLLAFPPKDTPGRTIVLHLDLSATLCTPLSADRQTSERNDVLLQAVRRAIREEIAQLAPLTSATSIGQIDRNILKKLTPRQTQILGLLARGYTNAKIAKQLGVALSSVKAQTAALLRALNCTNRTEAALLGAKLGLDQAA